MAEDLPERIPLLSERLEGAIDNMIVVDCQDGMGTEKRPRGLSNTATC